MKKVRLILLCNILFICCCCEKKSTTGNSADSTFLVVRKAEQSKEDSIEYRKLFRPQKPEDSFNQNKPQYSKYKNQIDVSDYKQFVRIDNVLRRRGLDICKLNTALESIAEKARRQSKEKYPDYYVGQIQLNNELQMKWRKAYLRKYNITENDATLVVLLFTTYNTINLCD